MCRSTRYTRGDVQDADFHERQLQLHPLALARHRPVAGRHRRRCVADGHARAAARHRLLRRHVAGRQFEQDVDARTRCATPSLDCRATKSCSSTASRRSASVLIRLAQDRGRGRGRRARAGVAAGRSRRCAAAGLPNYEVDSREIVGPVIGADLQRRGHLRDAGLDCWRSPSTSASGSASRSPSARLRRRSTTCS